MTEADALVLRPRLAALQGELLRGGRAVEVRTFHGWFSQLLRAAPLAFLQAQGIAPDIEVEITPTDAAAGRDSQLERAVHEAMKLLEKTPLKRVPRPAPADRTTPPRRTPGQ